MIFQQFNLVPRLDVVSNVLHGTLNRRSTLATIFNLWPDDDIHRAIDILDRLGIAEQAPKRAEALSGGQQQRVAIARALMQDPKIILADEPIASLDPMNAQVVMDALRRIHEEDGRTVIANLHTLDTARRYCDRVIGMRDGRDRVRRHARTTDHRRRARHLRRRCQLFGSRHLDRDRRTRTSSPIAGGCGASDPFHPAGTIRASSNPERRP